MPCVPTVNSVALPSTPTVTTYTYTPTTTDYAHHTTPRDGDAILHSREEAMASSLYLQSASRSVRAAWTRTRTRARTLAQGSTTSPSRPNALIGDCFDR